MLTRISFLLQVAFGDGLRGVQDQVQKYLPELRSIRSNERRLVVVSLDTRAVPNFVASRAEGRAGRLLHVYRAEPLAVPTVKMRESGMIWRTRSAASRASLSSSSNVGARS